MRLAWVLFLSGAAALIYEIAWLQWLSLVIGSATPALGTLLACYMGGMCLGSLWLPHRLSLSQCEVCIGAWGAVLVYLLPVLSGWGLHPVGAGALLLPSTLCMGATLPLAAGPQGHQHRSSGVLYSANLLGAMIGCSLAGFVLLPLSDVASACGVAIGCNFLAALVARGQGQAWPAPQHQDSPPQPLLLTATALSGLCALSCEVVWTRLLGLLLGPTAYTFSLVLAVFLLGLALGSAAASRWLARWEARRAWGICQCLSVLAIVWGYLWLCQILPRLSWSPEFLGDLARCCAVVLPASMCWGAAFTLALRAEGSIARAYAANTWGSIAGSLITSLVALPLLGSCNTMRALTVLASLSATLLLAHPLPLLLAPLAALLPAVPPALIAYGGQAGAHQDLQALYVGEGINSAVAVTQIDPQIIAFHVCGRPEASNNAQDLHLEQMLARLPARVHPQARSVLVVGCGAGITAGTFLEDPKIERVVVVELEPLVARRVAPYFIVYNNDVVDDPRVEFIFDDARHYFRTHQEKFDIITSDPIHPWVRGSASLYTLEYFHAMRDHLNEGGVISQWLPLYESQPLTIKSELATFCKAFPEATAWGNPAPGGHGYDMVLLAGRKLETVPPFEEFAHPAGNADSLRDYYREAPLNLDRNLRLQYLAGRNYRQQLADSIYRDILASAKRR